MSVLRCQEAYSQQCSVTRRRPCLCLRTDVRPTTTVRRWRCRRSRARNSTGLATTTFLLPRRRRSRCWPWIPANAPCGRPATGYEPAARCPAASGSTGQRRSVAGPEILTEPAGSSTALLLSDQPSHDVDDLIVPQRDPCRTLWARPGPLHGVAGGVHPSSATARRLDRSLGSVAATATIQKLNRPGHGGQAPDTVVRGAGAQRGGCRARLVLAAAVVDSRWCWRLGSGRRSACRSWLRCFRWGPIWGLVSRWST